MLGLTAVMESFYFTYFIRQAPAYPDSCVIMSSDWLAWKVHLNLRSLVGFESTRHERTTDSPVETYFTWVSLVRHDGGSGKRRWSGLVNRATDLRP